MRVYTALFHIAPDPVFHEVMEDPFETLVASHHAEIHRYLVRLTARGSDADDLSQETFLRAYRAWRSLSPDANVRAWLFAIATNLFRNHFRGEKRRARAHAEVERSGTEHADHDPEGEALSNETRMIIDAAVAKLPLKQRTAFVLRKIHGFDYDAIGQNLRCSGESARAHVFHALRKIRRTLDGHELSRMEEPR
jgi:RNA polymerase sigma-70 factor, ECF subfamily